MPAGPIGSSWATGSWSDTAWEVGTWADLPAPSICIAPRPTRAACWTNFAVNALRVPLKDSL